MRELHFGYERRVDDEEVLQRDGKAGEVVGWRTERLLRMREPAHDSLLVADWYALGKPRP